MGRGAHGGGRAAVPGWLGRLVEESFFVGCGAHESRKKNEKNIFCLDCCSSICPHCAPAHSSHPLLQVRRYVYNDVVRLDDLEKLIDCSFVQCQSGVSEAKASVSASQRLRKHLPELRQNPSGALPLLLPLLQGRARGVPRRGLVEHTTPVQRVGFRLLPLRGRRRRPVHAELDPGRPCAAVQRQRVRRRRRRMHSSISY
ncbi:uncharacterized protein LOC122044415 isoform X3 [Zingiber officinale]|uniref:uncharacterized protein LOC122044415 isoform X3 n=1 Tax=Zingiber officinale TaxID=94328 RepID=UPI001C4C083A|nr:uncharacterized protein LOC122044415 isoform X3 [Zingiber officinale]